MSLMDEIRAAARRRSALVLRTVTAATCFLAGHLIAHGRNG
jgi:hypothetical protein